MSLVLPFTSYISKIFYLLNHEQFFICKREMIPRRVKIRKKWDKGFLKCLKHIDIYMYFPFLSISNLFIYERKRTMSDLSLIGKYIISSAKITLPIVHIIERWLEEVVNEGTLTKQAINTKVGKKYYKWYQENVDIRAAEVEYKISKIWCLVKCMEFFSYRLMKVGRGRISG